MKVSESSSKIIYSKLITNHNEQLIALIDSGATISTVRYGLVKNKLINKMNKVIAKGISGPSFETMGTVSLNLRPSGSKSEFFKHNFHVLPQKIGNLKVEMILGGDFLDAYEADISYRLCKVFYGKAKRH